MRSSFAIRLAWMSALVVVICVAPLSQAAEELTVYAYRYGSKQLAQKGIWSVALRFNNPVFPSNLEQNIQVVADGAKVKFELLERDSLKKASAASNSLLLAPTKSSGTPVSVTVTVSKGISDTTGRRVLAKNFSYRFISWEKIAVRGHSTFYRSKQERGVKISLSHYVSEEDLAAAIELDPGVDDLSLKREGGLNYVVTGQFDYEKDYVLKILPKAVSNGAAVLEPWEFRFKGPGLRPEITLKARHSIVELRSRQLLPIKVSNVTKVRCKIVKVPPVIAADLVEMMDTTEGERKVRIKNKLGEFKRFAATSKVSPVFVGQVIEDADAFFVQEAKDKAVTYSLPLSFRKNPEQGGSWLVAFSDADQASAEPTEEFIQITNLSISYKLSSEMLLVWVTSIYEGQPVAGAEVLLVNSKGQRYFAGKTDRNGLLKIKDRDKFPSIPRAKLASTPVDALVDLALLSSVLAATPSDSCAVSLNSGQLKPVGVKQTAKVTEAPGSRPNGHVFTERGVYKPGETVHFKFVSRVYKNKRIVPPAGDKVNIEISGPRKDVNYSKELTLNEFGSCWDSLQTKTFFPVGTYTISVKAKKADGGDQTFTNTFQVQEFKKIRHFAKISAKREERETKAYVGLKRTEEYLTVEVQGLYYTGGPVKHGRVRWKANLVPVTNSVKGLAGFFFGNEDNTTRFLESGESVLDSHGKLHVVIPLDTRLLTGVNGIEISATVLDVDGEPATEVYTYNPKPRYLIGIAPHPKQVQPGYAAPLKVIVVDAAGRRVSSGTITAGTMQESNYRVEKRQDDEEGRSYSYEKGWRKIVSSQQPIRNGEAVFNMEFGEWGDYMISFTFEEKGRQYTSQTLFKVGWSDYGRWADEEYEQYRDRREKMSKNEILVAMNKKEYAVGETVRLEFNTNRPVRKCLVTLEKDHVLDAKVIDVNGTLGSYEFVMKEEYLPNVFVSVLATAGREGFPVYTSQSDSDIPTVFFGYADISVRSQIQRLRLEIEPTIKELKGRPAEQKKLSFRVTDHKGAGVAAEMAVCVVDEAVLALTGYKTPELSSLSKFNLPLAVFTGDLRLELISQDLYRMFSTKPLTGGGMGVGEVHPSLRKDFRPVAYFNPGLVTDADGRATIEFKLPDTTTAYRVFAVVCDKGSGFVSGQRKMVVTKEFFVEPSPPRFFCPGDKAVFPLIVQNKTSGKGVAKIQGKGADTLRVSIVDPSLSLEPFSGAVIKARTEIPGGLDQAVFVFQGKFEGEAGVFDDAVEMKIPIHSRFLPARRVKMGDFTEKIRIDPSLPEELKTVSLGDVNRSDFQANLVLSTNQWSKITPGLKYLLRYPFGCVEQTSSGVIPLATLRGLAQSGALPGITSDQVDKFLKKGVNRLLSMQTSSGGFGYWPGDMSPSWWGTMYAVSALTLAREGGFEAPKERMDKAVEFLRTGLFNKGDGTHTYAWTKEYALYNLAVNKALTVQELEPFLRDYNSSSNQSKALLLLAANKTGALPRARIVEMASKLNPKVDPSRIDFRNSSFREMALCLLAITEAKASQVVADSLAGRLLNGLKPDGIWLSTADTGWCLLALGKYFQSQKGDKPKTASVRVRYGDNSPPLELQVSDASAEIEINPSKLLKTGANCPGVRFETPDHLYAERHLSGCGERSGEAEQGLYSSQTHSKFERQGRNSNRRRGSRDAGHKSPRPH